MRAYFVHLKHGIAHATRGYIASRSRHSLGAASGAGLVRRHGGIPVGQTSVSGGGALQAGLSLPATLMQAQILLSL